MFAETKWRLRRTDARTATFSKMPRRRKGHSFTLSYLLRHGATDAGLAVDSGGWVAVDDLLRVDRLRGLTVPELHDIVAVDAKGRYALQTRGGVEYIRANQGHSLQVRSQPLHARVPALIARLGAVR